MLLCGLLLLFLVNRADCQVPATSPEPTGTGGNGRSASIYVYRNWRTFGAAIEPALYLDDLEIAKMANGSYFLLKVEPGVHTIRSTDKKVELNMGFKSGTDYFVRIDLRPTWYSIGKGEPILESCEAFRSGVKDLKPLTAHHVRDKQRVIVPSDEGTEVRCAGGSEQ